MADLDPEAVERLSAKLHAIYQDEARRQAGTGDDAVRHPDDYAALPEHTKEYDRVLARYILRREAAAGELLAAARSDLASPLWSDPDTAWWLHVRHTMDCIDQHLETDRST
jgi:hypothetical protein